MTETHWVVKEKFETGDVTVDGLFHGALAGALMLVFLGIAGIARGESPLDLLSRFAPNPDASPVIGALLHLAVSAIYAAVFYAVWNVLSARRRRGPSARRDVLAGLLFGSALFLLAQWIILPGTASPLAAIPPAMFMAAHLVYGLALGWLFYRSGFVKES